MSPELARIGESGLKFRQVAPEDVDELSDFFARNNVPAVVRHFHPFALTRESARRIATHTGLDSYFGLFKDNRMIGFSMLRGWSEGYAVPSLGVVVDISFQGNGAGRRLTDETIAVARFRGCRRVRLSVYGSNERAIRLYESEGFRVSSRGSISREGLADVRLIMDLEIEAIRRTIPVAEPALVGNEARYVLDCMKSGWISSNGKYIAQLEDSFARFCGVSHGVACCNGTVALHLALVALGIGPGDEVIVPTLTFISTANAVTYCGARPVFADSDPSTWNLDPERLEELVTPRTRCIIVVHLYGEPARMDRILDIARKYGLSVVEDAAEAHGALYGGRRVGSIGDVGTFSFYGNKIVTTGEGGMVVSSNSSLMQRVRLLRGQAQDPNRRYWFSDIGFNYRMTNIAAAIGLGQVERIDWHIERRREVGAWYREFLSPLSDVGLQGRTPGAVGASWMNTILLGEDVDLEADSLMGALLEAGVESRPVFYPIHALPPYAGANQEARFPVAERIARRGVSLPSSAKLQRDDVEYVCQRVFEMLRRGA